MAKNIMSLKKIFLFFAALIFLGGVVYFPALSGGAVFDDHEFFASSYVSGYGDLLAGARELRGVAYGTFAVQSFFGGEWFGFHVVNLMMHLFCAASLVVLIRLLNGGQEYLIGALFVVHPVLVYGVAYLVQRSILMATFFSLLSLIFFILANLANKVRVGVVFFVFSFVLFYLALHSKEHVIMVPFVALIIAWQLNGWAGVRKSALWFFSVAILCLEIVVRMKGVIGVPYEASLALDGVHENTGYWLGVMNQCEMFFVYVFLWVLPFSDFMSVDMRLAFPLFQGWVGAFLVAGYCFWGLAGAWLLWKYRSKNKGLVGLGMLAPWLLFFSEFASIRVVEGLVLYRAYLWYPFFFLIFSALLKEVVISTFGRWCIVFVVVFFATQARARAGTFSSDLAAWNDAVRWVGRYSVSGSILVDRVFYNRGKARAQEGDLRGAEADFRQALAINNENFLANFGLAQIFYGKKRYIEADAAFTHLLSLNDKFIPALRGRAEARRMLKDEVGRRQDLNKACELKDPSSCFVLSKERDPEAEFVYHFAK